MEIRVLGPVGLRDGGSEVSLGGQRQRRLLAALVVNAGKVVSVDRLIEAVWAGDETSDRAAKTLRTYVSRLRLALGDGHVHTDEPGYSLVVDPDVVDARRFERLTASARARLDAGDAVDAKARFDEALDLWHGRAYDEFASEPWVWAEAARLEELRLTAREDRAQAMLASEDITAAIAELEQLTSEFPLRDHAQQKLMLALYRAGRQADALRAFHRHREHLADEVGLDPSPELVELERMIATRDPKLDAATAPRALRGYQLGEKLGEGRFGVVYRATQPSVDREVAVKMIHPDLADDPAFVQRFEAEAQLVARLEHRCIVPLYDYWREPGGAYLVMRWMRGGTLEGRLAGGPLTLGQTVEVVQQIGGALAAAHHAGVIHRDLKPSNVLLDEEGNAYLSDFGIAVGPGGDELRSAGSPAYASPEQMAGGELTPSSDTYALGVIVYELLTGRLPYRSPTATGLIGEKLARPVPGLSAQRADLPSAVDAVVQRATMPEAGARYAGALDFVEALRVAASVPRGARTTDDALDRPPAVQPATRAAGATLASAALPATNPYKGLRAFDEADAADFFGRDRMVDQVVDRLRDGDRFVAIVGPSGSGKSSVVRAGIVPRLREGVVEGSDAWFVTTMTPGRHPYEELESALLRVAINPPATLLDQLRDGERGLLRAVQRTLPPDGRELVLVLDQFEELFTQVDDAGERDGFLTMLACTAQDVDARVRVLSTIRADYFDRPLSNGAIGELMAMHSVPITPLSPEEIERAVAGPAERSGVRLEPGLLATVVGDVADHPAALPFLQYCLTELYDRRDGLVMTLDAYRDLGAVSGALGRQAEETYNQLDDQHKQAARELFTRLVTPGEGEADTRRRARRSELLALPVGATAMEDVIDEFGRQRLLTFDRDPATREPTVEIAHEALIAAWPRLHEWVDEDREGMKVMRGIAESTAVWTQGGRDEADLLRGGRLEAAETWAAANPERLSGDEEQFVESAVAARETAARKAQRNTRRLRRLVTATAIALVLALIAGGVAFSQRNEAARQRDQARSQARDQALSRLAAQARLIADTDQSQAMLFALEADRLRPSDETLGALESVLLKQPHVLRTFHTGLPLSSFDVDPSGTTAIAGTADGRLAKIDLSDGSLETIWQVSDDGPVWGFADAKGVLYAVPQTEDGRRSVSSGSRPRLLSRDLDGTEHVLVSDRTVNPVAGETLTLARYADATGQQVFAVANADEVRVMTAQGDVVRTFPTAGVDVLAFSGDGTRLAIGTGFESLSSMLTITVVNTETGDPVGPVLTVPWGLYELDRQGTRLTVSNLVRGEASLIDVESGARLNPPRDPGDGIRWAFSSDSKLVANVDSAGVTRVFDAETGSQVGQDVAGEVSNKVGLGFGPTGEYLFTAEQGGDIAELGIGGRTKLSRQLDASGFLAFWSWDAKTLAVPSVPANDHITLLDRDSGKVRTTLINPQPYDNWLASGVTQAAFNPAGTEVAIGSVAVPGKPAAVFVYSVADGRLLRRLDVPNVPRIGQPLAWSWDGGTIAAGAPFRILFLDAKTGSPRAEARVPEIQFSINGGFDDKGRFVTTGMPFGVTVVFDEHGRRLASYGSASEPRIGFELPGDRLVFTNQSSGEVQIVGLLDGKPEGKLFSGASVAFAAPLSEHLGWAESSVGSITLWDPATGEAVGDPFVATDHPPQAAVFPSSDGRYLAAGGDHFTLWDVDPAVWRERACEAAGRNLTRAEWKRYLPEGEPYHVTCPQYPAGE